MVAIVKALELADPALHAVSGSRRLLDPRPLVAIDPAIAGGTARHSPPPSRRGRNCEKQSRSTPRPGSSSLRTGPSSAGSATREPFMKRRLPATAIGSPRGPLVHVPRSRCLPMIWPRWGKEKKSKPDCARRKARGGLLRGACRGAAAGRAEHATDIFERAGSRRRQTVAQGASRLRAPDRVPCNNGRDQGDLDVALGVRRGGLAPCSGRLG